MQSRQSLATLELLRSAVIEISSVEPTAEMPLVMDEMALWFATAQHITTELSIVKVHALPEHIIKSFA